TGSARASARPRLWSNRHAFGTTASQTRDDFSASIESGWWAGVPREIAANSRKAVPGAKQQLPSEPDDEPAVDVVTEDLVRALMDVGVDGEAAVRDLKSSVRPAYHTECPLRARNPPRHGLGRPDDERRPQAGARAGAADLAAGPLLDRPEVERSVVAASEDAAERAVLEHNSRRGRGLRSHGCRRRRQGERSDDEEDEAPAHES